MAHAPTPGLPHVSCLRNKVERHTTVGNHKQTRSDSQVGCQVKSGESDLPTDRIDTQRDGCAPASIVHLGHDLPETPSQYVMPQQRHLTTQQHELHYKKDLMGTANIYPEGTCQSHLDTPKRQTRLILLADSVVRIHQLKL